jgi:hypothetical protein
MADQKTLADLRKCMRAASGDAGKMTACENAFKDAGGIVTPDVTLGQGKVFTIADKSTAFVTNDGKVF